MNAILAARIATDLAAVVRIVPEPRTPLGYGSDLECWDDIHPTARQVTEAQALLGQWAYHMLYTTRGTLPGETIEEQSAGLNLLDMIGQDAGTRNAAQWQRSIEHEMTKSEQIDGAVAVVTVTGTQAQEFAVALTLTPADPTVKPFDLVLSVNPLGVFLEKIEGRA